MPSLLGGIGAGVVATVLAMALVGVLPRAMSVLNLINGWALPIGLLIGGAVRVGQRQRTSPGLRAAAVLLTYGAAMICFMHGVLNLGDEGYFPMAAVATLFLAPSFEPVVFALVLYPLLSVTTVIGGFSLGLGLVAAGALTQMTPFAIDGPFDTTPAAPHAAHA